MRCPKAKRISAYLDGELADGERTLFESHLQGCDRCALALEEMRALGAAFSTTERYTAPYGFSTRVIARAAAQKNKRSPWFAPLIIRSAEAAVLLVVISVGIMAGKFLINSSLAPKTANMASSFSLEIFEPAPPGSLGGAYLALTEAKNEK